VPCEELLRCVSDIKEEEEISPCLECTLTAEGGCSQVSVGCGRLSPRGSAPPGRAPRPNPPRPACASKCLGGRPPCWCAAPAFCAGVGCECSRRPSNPLPKEGLESNGFCLSSPPLPPRPPAPAPCESQLPYSCSRADELLPSPGPREAGGLGVPGLVVLWRRCPPGGGRADAGERASTPLSACERTSTRLRASTSLLPPSIAGI